MGESSYQNVTQFAGLVEAATAAADQEVARSNNDAAAGSDRQTFEVVQNNAQPANALPPTQSGQYDPDLTSLPNGAGREAVTAHHTRKRKRGNNSMSGEAHVAEMQAPRQLVLHEVGHDRDPALVHSAAALFRSPSKSSKKYTRPPMSKLFSSLQLLPEDFLHIQSAAKSYMLDEKHPERRDCVGQRGKTDSDMVKLKLWNCVQDFLDQEGNGGRFFGVGANKVVVEDGARQMNWPDDAQQIIKTCTPLLRRMVTNERQRQYAVESRRGGGESKSEGKVPAAGRQETSLGRATIAGIDDPITFTREKVDIFGDGFISGPVEASEWFNVYNSDGNLERIYRKAGFPRLLFLHLITNVDAHCRLFHGGLGSGPQCTDLCQSRLVERLHQLPIYQQCAPAKDPVESVREIFDIVITRLIGIRYWGDPVHENRSTSAPTVTAIAQKAAGAKRSTPRKKARLKPTESGMQGKAEDSARTLQLLIYVVRQEKCLVPVLEMPSSQCPNMETLRTQSEKHYGLVTLQEKGVTRLSEAKLKVWLADGLVRVEDDGQWMVALLSAQSVEWMGGQLRVLLEV